MSKMPETAWLEDEFGDSHEDQGSYGSWDCRKAYGYVHEYLRADTAAAQVAAAYERAANLCVDQFQAHLDLVITGNPDNARNRESAANMAEKLSHEIRALATDTQTDALEQVRREAERAGYERGVRGSYRVAECLEIIWTNIADDKHRSGLDATYAREKASVAMEIAEKILALLGNPTPDPDEQTEAAQELAFRKAVSS